MQSGWSVGLLMVAMGVLSVGGFGVPQPPTRAGWVIAGLLVCCGGLLFIRRPFAWWLGIGVSLLTIATGLIALGGRTKWALPVPPWLSIVVGLYITLRLIIARSYFRQRGIASQVEPQ